MPGRKPNILWILTTQWRAGAAGFAGDANARTPRLDALAAEAVNFAQAVTPHPFGPFARAALLTGVRSPENGVREYFDPLPANARTIAHELAARGYATAFFGKWHLARRDPSAPLVGEAHARQLVPEEARGGFAFWEGFESGFLLNDPWLHGTRLPEPVRAPGYQSDVLCTRAAEWAGARRGGAPWFCVASLEAPHPPYDAPAAGAAAMSPGEVRLAANVPRGGGAEERARRELAGYYAHIHATDTAIGRLLDALRGMDGGDETVVVFSSVHGDMHGAHGLFRKGWPHEESVRVPLLVRARGAKEARRGGTVSTAAVTLADLPRMTISLIERGKFFDAGGGGPERARISMPSVVRLPHQCDRVWRGVRTARRKLVLGEDGSPWLFFDLERDPLELRNLAADAEWAAERERLRAWAAA
ncbi:sulfatase-like hydrolase/transferase [Termitidicoccus mucosus]|uniref:Sulfatase n=1 Tax=Termitidicoccus mucosus TaxID=1184151 RepID=A0A178IF77_9BACT|nr:sulfatase [Opitutaceae bacterium TSB47]